jgi:hypothetical protein
VLMKNMDNNATLPPPAACPSAATVYGCVAHDLATRHEYCPF